MSVNCLLTPFRFRNACAAFKSWCFLAFLALSAACSRQEQAPGTPVAATNAPREAQTASLSPPVRSAASAGSRYSDLVRAADARALFLNDLRLPDEFARACDAEPDNPDAWFVRGCRVRADGNLAGQWLERAIRLAPDAANPWIALAEYRLPNARNAFTNAFVRIASAAQADWWCSAGCEHAADAGVYGFIMAGATASLHRCYAALLMANYHGHPDDFISLAQRLSTSGDRFYHAAAIDMLAHAVRKAYDNPALQARYQAVLDQSRTPFEREIVRLASMGNREWNENGMAAARAAMAAATDAGMRSDLALALLKSDHLKYRDASNIFALCDAAIGNDGWSTALASDLPGKLWEFGETGMLVRLVERSFACEHDAPRFAIRALDAGGQLGGNVHQPCKQAVVALLLTNFPGNFTALLAVNKYYEQSGLRDQDLEFRKTVLDAAKTEDAQALAGAQLIYGLHAQGKFDEANALGARFRSRASNDVNMAMAIGQCLLWQGRTNDALDVMLSFNRNVDFAVIEPMLSMVLLNYHDGIKWPDAATAMRVAEFAEPFADGFYGGTLVSYETVDMLVQNGFFDEALQQVMRSVRANREVALYGIRRETDKFAKARDFLLAQYRLGSTQQCFYTGMARVFRSIGMNSEEREANIMALRLATSPAERLAVAKRCVTRDGYDGYEPYAKELAAVFREAMDNAGADLTAWISFADTYAALGGDQPVDALFDQAWQRATNRNSKTVVEFLVKHGRTNEASTVLQSLLTDQALSLDDLIEIAENEGVEEEDDIFSPTVPVSFGDTGRELAARIGAAMTNTAAIAQHGTAYLALLMRTGADTNHIKALLGQWLADSNIAVRARYALCEQSDLGYVEKLEAFRALSGDASDNETLDDIRVSMLELVEQHADTAQCARVALDIRSDPDATMLAKWRTIGTANRVGLTNESLAMLQLLAKDPATMPNDLCNVAEMYARFGMCTEAIHYAQCVLADSRVTPDNIADIAKMYKNMQRFADAIALYEKRLPQMQTALAHAYLALGNADKAAQCAQKALENEGASTDVLELMLRIGKPESTVEVLKQNLDSAGTAEDVCYAARRLIGFQKDAGLPVDIASIIAKVLAVERSAYTLLMCAEESTVMGDAEGATSYVMDALACSPSDRDLSRLTALSLAIADSNADNSKKLALLDAVLPKTPKDERDGVQIAILDALLAAENPREAARRAAEFAQTANLNEALHGRIIDAYAAAGDTEQAWNSAQTIKDIEVFTDTAKRLGKIAEAMPRLENVIRNSPRNVCDSTARELADVCDEAGCPEQALALLKLGASLAGESDRQDLDFAIVRIMKRMGKCDEADAWLAACPASPMYEALKQDVATMRAVIAAARLSINAAPDDPAAYAQAATRYAENDMPDDAAREWEKAAALAATADQRRDYLKLYAECCTVAGKSDLAAAAYRKLLDDASLQFDERYRLRTLIADICDEAGRSKEAKDICRENIRDCEEIVRTGGSADTTETQFRLAELYGWMGDTAKAKRMLQKIADEHPGTETARRAIDELDDRNARAL